MLAHKKSGLITSISQQKDSTNKGHPWNRHQPKLIDSSLNWNQSKAAKVSTAVDKLMTLVVKTMRSTTKDETSVRSAYVIPLDTARVERKNELI